MIEFLELPEDRRRALLEQIEYTEGIQQKALEKDWWVTLTLKALFTCKYKQYIVFKGGTSLSKCWKLIERFSEDIDIALAPEAFGMSYEENPSASFVKKLKRAGCDFTSNELKVELEKQFTELGVPAGILKIEAEPVKENMPDTDPQTILVHYPTLIGPNDYLADVVKIEVSVRSLQEPNAMAKVQSILSESERFSIYKETPFEVLAVQPYRTFLEKMFLLHEEFQKPDPSKIRSERMSRHLYDLERMMDKEAGAKALEDQELYKTIIYHRLNYSRLKDVDYETHSKETLSFIPPTGITAAYAKDYETMRSVMIYGDAPEFDDLIKRLTELLNRVRNMPN